MKPADEPVVTTTRAGSTVDIVGARVVAGDARAQRRDAERLGIAAAARHERRPRRRDRGRRRGRRRLADLHVDDAAARGLDARRRRHHVHDHERRHVAARRGRDQPFCRFQHRSSLVVATDPPAPLLPHSAASVPISRRKRAMRGINLPFDAMGGGAHRCARTLTCVSQGATGHAVPAAAGQTA